MRRGGDGSRTALIASLLLLCLFAAALLASHAHTAIRYHRRTAESVLRDYAALAASELARRCSSEVGYRGYYVLTGALTRERDAGRLGSGTLQRLRQGGDPRLSDAARLARRLVEVGSSGEIEGFGEPLPGWLSEQLARRRSVTEDAGFLVVVGREEGRVRRFVFTSSQESPSAVGFEVDAAALGDWFARVVAREALLPPSLGRGDVSNASLFVAVLESTGEELFRSGSQEFPGLGAEVPFGDAYAGSFEGLRVRVSIDPAVAPSLVIGGLPRSRLPLLGGLLALITVLIVVAILQLRRERALARLRSEFVSSVSHELRTPLTQIRMFTETLMLKRVRSEDESQRSLAIIDKEARRLSHLVENLLRFSGSERGSLRISPELQSLEPLVADAVESFLPLAEGAGMRVRTRLAAARARVDGDAFRQVLLNLLDNAVKYGPAGQEILVTLETETGVARLRVEDEGPGVPPRERRRVFERFQRLSRDRGSAVAGAGIGLSVVRELVELHGGRCRVGSTEQGGARFEIELAAAVSEPIPDGISPAEAP